MILEKIKTAGRIGVFRATPAFARCGYHKRATNSFRQLVALAFVMIEFHLADKARNISVCFLAYDLRAVEIVSSCYTVNGLGGAKETKSDYIKLSNDVFSLYPFCF